MMSARRVGLAAGLVGLLLLVLVLPLDQPMLRFGSAEIPSTAPAQAFSSAWPQLGNNPQHTNYSPDNLVPQTGAGAVGSCTTATHPVGPCGWFTQLWHWFPYPEHIAQQAQPIVNNGAVFMPTTWSWQRAGGAIYAFETVGTGNSFGYVCRWVFPTSCSNPQGTPVTVVGPFFNSVAATNSAVYAVDENAVVWSLSTAANFQTPGAPSVLPGFPVSLRTLPGVLDTRSGVTAAIVMDDNTVPVHLYVVQRSGVVSSIATGNGPFGLPAAGTLEWQYATGYPVGHTTPAYDPSTHQLFVAGLDSRITALNVSATAASAAWVQRQPGSTLDTDLSTHSNHVMVIPGGKVVTRVFAASQGSGGCCGTLATNDLIQQGNGLLDATYSTSTQQAVLTDFTNKHGANMTGCRVGATNPPSPTNLCYSLSHRVLREFDGAYLAANQYMQTNAAAQDGGDGGMPCYDAPSGYLAVPTVKPNWVVGTGVTGWALVDPATGLASPMADVLGQRGASRSSAQSDAFGYGNRDGSIFPLCTASGVYVNNTWLTDTWSGFYARPAGGFNAPGVNLANCGGAAGVPCAGGTWTDTAAPFSNITGYPQYNFGVTGSSTVGWAWALVVDSASTPSLANNTLFIYLQGGLFALQAS